MKENFDPHQVVISREYFDKLLALATPNDHLAGTSNHPNRTIVARIKRHANKYNRQLHNERQVEVEEEVLQKRLWRKRQIELVNKYAQSAKIVKTHPHIFQPLYVMEGCDVFPVLVLRESQKYKYHLRVMITRGSQRSFEKFHVSRILMQLPPNYILNQ